MNCDAYARIAGGTADAKPEGTPAISLPRFRQRRPPRTIARIPAPRSNEILVLPLGGMGRIGMNWTLYGHNGRWILVDAGTAFADENDDGVDALVPDPSVLKPILRRLDGLLVTHAHEDHIGAVHRLWPHTVTCPVYATPFAAAILSRRFEEAGILGDVDLRTFRAGSRFRAGPFTAEAIRMTHSVPEPVAFALSCPGGTVLHTGDWKIDPTPLVGLPADLDAIRRIGDAGLLALVCDSTNADRDLPVTSELHTREAFRRLFASRQGIVAVCCFGSNVARSASAVAAAGECGRRIALAGRSMRSNNEIARELGLIPDEPHMLAQPSHLRGLDRRETALVCTGTQGEENAALARLARGRDWRLPELGAGDTLVLSSRTIPGNEAAVGALIDAFRARGVEVIGAADLVDGYPVHVTGHAGRRELRGLHQLARPRFVLPVHGEERHLAAHAELALTCGAAEAPVGSEGEVFTVSAAGMRSLGRLSVPLAPLYNDAEGNRLPFRPARGASASTLAFMGA